MVLPEEWRVYQRQGPWGVSRHNERLMRRRRIRRRLHQVWIPTLAALAGFSLVWNWSTLEATWRSWKPMSLISSPRAVVPAGTPSFRNCAAARAAGYGPIRRAQPGYSAHLDTDGDGIACERSWRW